jgi:hypothetical protein
MTAELTAMLEAPAPTTPSPAAAPGPAAALGGSGQPLRTPKAPRRPSAAPAAAQEVQVGGR